MWLHFQALYAMSICVLKPACFFVLFLFLFGFVCFTFYLEGGIDGFFCFYSYVGSFVFFLSFYNRHIHVNWKHVKFKQDAKVPRRSPEKKKANEVSSVDYQIKNI